MAAFGAASDGLVLVVGGKVGEETAGWPSAMMRKGQQGEFEVRTQFRSNDAPRPWGSNER